MYRIETEDLCRDFGPDKKVLNKINLKIEKGEIYGLIGKNGAGKTTLIKILTTLLLPTSGKARINGHDVVLEEEKVRKELGVVLSNNRSMYLKLTAADNLAFFAKLYGIGKKEREERMERLLRQVQLWDHRNAYVENYSYGMMQKLNIIRALLADPDVLILDEPTNGLDLEAKNELRKIILFLKEEGKTVLLTTHDLEEIEVLATRVGILMKGQIAREGSPGFLEEQFGKTIFDVRIKAENIGNRIEKLEERLGRKVILKPDEQGVGMILRFAGERGWDVGYVTSILSEEEIQVEEISRKRARLEDVFRDV